VGGIPSKMADKILLKIPGTINRCKTGYVKNTPLLLNLLKVCEWNKVPNKPIRKPLARGTAGLLYISTDELYTIPPLIIIQNYIESSKY
jgi:hypothetical protein